MKEEYISMKKGSKTKEEDKKDEIPSIDDALSFLTLSIISEKKSIPGSGIVIFWPKESDVSKPPVVVNINDDENHEIFELAQAIKLKDDADKKAENDKLFIRALNYANQVADHALFGGKPDSIIIDEAMRARANREAAESYEYNKNKCGLSFEVSATRGIEAYVSVIKGPRQNINETDKLALAMIVNLTDNVIKGLM